MGRFAKKSIQCDVEVAPDFACSIPSTPSPGARCAMSLESMRRTTVTSSCKAPPPLSHDFIDTDPHDHIDFPATPSPLADRGGSLGTSQPDPQPFQMSMLASCLLPAPLPLPQECFDSLNQHAIHYGHGDSRPAQHNSALQWSPQQVPPPPVLPPRLDNCVSHAFVHPPPAPAPFADECCRGTFAASAGGAFISNVQPEGISTSTPSVQMAAWTRHCAQPVPEQLHGWQNRLTTSFNDHATVHSAQQFQHESASGTPYKRQGGSKGPFLQLEHMLAFDDSTATPETSSPGEDAASDTPPQLGSAELPSIGSLGHYMRRCKPCAFVMKTGCANGSQCVFCHLCPPGEKKRRRKEKRSILSAARKLGSLDAPREDGAMRPKSLQYA